MIDGVGEKWEFGDAGGEAMSGEDVRGRTECANLAGRAGGGATLSRLGWGGVQWQQMWG